MRSGKGHWIHAVKWVYALSFLHEERERERNMWAYRKKKLANSQLFLCGNFSLTLAMNCTVWQHRLLMRQKTASLLINCKFLPTSLLMNSHRYIHTHFVTNLFFCLIIVKAVFFFNAAIVTMMNTRVSSRVNIAFFLLNSLNNNFRNEWSPLLWRNYVILCEECWWLFKVFWVYLFFWKEIEFSLARTRPAVENCDLIVFLPNNCKIHACDDFVRDISITVLPSSTIIISLSSIFWFSAIFGG